MSTRHAVRFMSTICAMSSGAHHRQYAFHRDAGIVDEDVDAAEALARHLHEVAQARVVFSIDRCPVKATLPLVPA